MSNRLSRSRSPYDDCPGLLYVHYPLHVVPVFEWDEEIRDGLDRGWTA